MAQRGDPSRAVQVHPTSPSQPWRGRTPSALRTLLTACFLVLLSGCVASRFPASWDHSNEVRTPHFVFVGDVPRQQLQRLGAAAESTYVAYEAAYEGGPGEGPIQVFVFSDLADYGRFLGRALPSTAELLDEQRRLEADGWTVQSALDSPRGHLESGPRGSEALIAFPFGRGSVSALRHELAHVFTAAAHGALPAWLDEGLAEHLRLEDDPDERAAVVEDVRATLAANRELPLDELVALDTAGFVERRETAYRSAWVLVSYLFASGHVVSPGDLGDARASGHALASSRTVQELATALFGESPERDD